MQKILTIAAREYRAMVGTKAFAFSICMMPVLMFGSMFAMRFLSNVGEIQQRKIVIIDQTGGFVPVVKQAAEQHNQVVRESAENKDKGDEFSFSKGSTFEIEELEPDSLSDDLLLELSDRIRKQDLYAFVVIPPEVQSLDASSPKSIDFYSEDSGMSDGRRWIRQIINDRILAMRLQDAGIDFGSVKIAQTPVRVRGLGPVETGSDGEIEKGEEKDELTAIFVPMVAMLMMFMVTFLAAQPMLESVLEEKSQRIAEVLLGSANPSQLMAGKLLGTVGGSLTVFTIYALGGYFVGRSQGYLDLVPMQMIPWFVLFQVFGVMFYAAIFMAVGASVSQLKEAQSMLLPVWMMMMIPMFVWIFVVQEPNGTMATALSMFPPAAATMMVLRMATGATIPVWQPIVCLLLLGIATAFVVFIAGRIFRVGILWQGKTPKLGELVRWAFSG